MPSSSISIWSACLNALFWTLVLWALSDSILRWLRISHQPTKVTHVYVPLHYLGGAVGMTFWLLGIGTVDYSRFNMEWLRPVALLIGMAGWTLTLAGRATLGRHWTPNVTYVSPDRRIKVGPYASIRHPIYLGEAFFFLGISLYLANVPTFTFLFLGGAIYNFYRANAEEGSVEKQ